MANRSAAFWEEIGPSVVIASPSVTACRLGRCGQGWTGPLGPRSRRNDCMTANVVVVGEHLDVRGGEHAGVPRDDGRGGALGDGVKGGMPLRRPQTKCVHGEPTWWPDRHVARARLQRLR